jgi:hypothetical protein
MIATNVSTGRDPEAYAQLRRDCEAILDIARDMEIFALNNADRFFDNDEFLRRKAEFKSALQSLNNLTSAL